MSNGSIVLKRRTRESVQHEHDRDCGFRRHRRNATKPGGERVHQIMRADLLSLGVLTKGTVVRARIAFADCDDYKVRPAIVVGRRGRVVTVVPCSSSPRATTSGDIPIAQLDCAGLTTGTTARTGRTLLIDRVDCIEVLGYLGAEDAARIFSTLHRA
ncbi:hypothetical protein [Microbacterium kyungheense]|uniref:hypothetical protein n=1 Tax=Microbacterium kyungheense TaxID=1263636 RepID=UPI00115254A2|nr:hypothetical protein [Microbacterium kyungheense]